MYASAISLELHLLVGAQQHLEPVPAVLPAPVGQESDFLHADQGIVSVATLPHLSHDTDLCNVVLNNTWRVDPADLRLNLKNGKAIVLGKGRLSWRICQFCPSDFWLAFKTCRDLAFHAFLTPICTLQVALVMSSMANTRYVQWLELDEV